MALNYKMVEVDGVQAIAVSERGFPIVVDDESDKEMALDAVHLYTKVPDLQNQLTQAKQKASKLSETTSLLSGIDDVAGFLEKANNALELTANIDQQKLIDAGKVEEIKMQAVETLQSTLEATKANMQKDIDSKKKEIQERDATIFQFMVADRFNSSKFVKEGMSITTNMAQKYFGDNFKIEVDPETGNRQVVGHYKDGTPIYSEERPGDIADFDEALQLLVDKDPDKDNFLVGKGGFGSGAGNGQGGGLPSDEAALQAQYNAAVEAKDIPLRISLKNQLAAKGIFV